MIKIFCNTTYLSLLSLIIALSAMAFAYFYLQLSLGLPPCPLCIVDRLALILIILTLILSTGLSRYLPAEKYRIKLSCYLLNFAWIALGIWASTKHILLQYFPDNQGSCLPQTDNNLLELFTSAFAGTSDCGFILWNFMGFSIPEQTLALFGLLLIFNSRLVYLQRHARRES